LINSPITTAVSALVVPGSLREGEERERRGFDLEAEALPEQIVSVAALYRGAGYFLECLTAVDREDFRELWYQFNRFDRCERHLVRVGLDENDTIPTVSHVYGSARWFEREAFDMMGIHVEGHPNLKRLLLPEDADFHPLRRDQCIDDELRETREKRRAKRIAQAEKAKAKAEAEAAAAAEAAEAPTEPQTDAVDADASEPTEEGKVNEAPPANGTSPETDPGASSDSAAEAAPGDSGEGEPS